MSFFVSENSVVREKKSLLFLCYVVVFSYVVFCCPLLPAPSSPAKLSFAIHYTTHTLSRENKGTKIFFLFFSLWTQIEIRVFFPQKGGDFIERRRLEMYGSRKAKDRGAEEENILAIIDASGDKDTRDAHEDGTPFFPLSNAVWFPRKRE